MDLIRRRFFVGLVFDNLLNLPRSMVCAFTPRDFGKMQEQWQRKQRRVHKGPTSSSPSNANRGAAGGSWRSGPHVNRVDHLNLELRSKGKAGCTMAKAGYDAEMIQDFIEHLKWSLRVDHFELTAGPDALNPELEEQVNRAGRKRGVPRLLSLFSLTRDKPELTEKDMQEAMRRFAAYMAPKRDEQLRHLEALQEVLQEALAHATGRVFDVTVRGSEVLDGSFFTSPSS